MIVWAFFGLTLLLELPVWWWFHRKVQRAWLGLFFLVNLLTWPLLQFLIEYTSVPIPALELGVVVIEGACLSALGELGWKRAFLISLLANALSYGVGECINYWL